MLDLQAGRGPRRGARGQDAARRVHASKALRDYIVALLHHTRDDDRVELGASPRAGLMLLRAAKARALLRGRDHALPDDVQALARSALAPDDARAGGGGVARSGSSPTWWRRRRRSRGLACARPSAAPPSGLLLRLVAGTFDAEPLYVTGSALPLLGAGAAAWIASAPGGRACTARSARAPSSRRSR